jgi:hypothetical protein
LTDLLLVPLEDTVATDDDGIGLAGRHPLHVRVEHLLDRVDVACDKCVIAPEKELGAFPARGLLGHSVSVGGHRLWPGGGYNRLPRGP